MAVSRTRKMLLIGIVAAVVCAVLLTWLLLQESRDEESLIHLNENLSAAGAQFAQTEQELIASFGEGEYVEGFGGHLRTYEANGIRIGFSGDQDNDLYGLVSSIAFWDPAYAVYSINIGDDRMAAIDTLLSQGYKHVTEGMYRNGEYIISLSGADTVELIQIWFDDKDLRDRQY
ncbi:hypothetical protein [Paenibacillus harenae]|uniref:DUF4309 domain-containing protein n=1 Tax=Paenibacillus harenae TaxID=306543 RepID=A0ABT9U2U8_PAEHA|nr:hypothetical protein [Paenibacillus harenae]MDQ0113962.1 hypothetical protein [Paenibacillus harenae]